MSNIVDFEIDEFETKVFERMQRFRFLLKMANFDFKQYQYDGVEWCLKNEINIKPITKARGGIIADEMGLGKTITMIGLMFVNYLKRTLIVLPPALIKQWEEEIYRASKHRALIYYGANKKKIDNNVLNNAPIVITSYSSLLDKFCPLFTIQWSRAIFDEGHHLRNHKNKRFESCNKLITHIRWIISGTPIQNKIKDFYNLCKFIGIQNIRTKEGINYDIAKTCVLRRTKEQVGLNLLPVNLKVINVNWIDDNEKYVAKQIHTGAFNSFKLPYTNYELARIHDDIIIKAFMLCRQICINTEIIKPKIYEKPKKIKEIDKDDEDEEIEYELNYNEIIQKISNKIIVVLNKLVENKNNGKGKIVFCYFREEIDLIASKLKEIGFKYIKKYDGRNTRKENLNEYAEVLVIQYACGCEGLNLQKYYSEVYFVSSHWNPAVEDQAIARCHRLGQTKEVDVYKFVMDGFGNETLSLDKYVEKTQKEKRLMITDICNNLK